MTPAVIIKGHFTFLLIRSIMMKSSTPKKARRTAKVRIKETMGSGIFRLLIYLFKKIILFRGKRQYCRFPCFSNGPCDHPLVFRAVSGYSSRDHLASFREEILQIILILKIKGLDPINAHFASFFLRSLEAKAFGPARSEEHTSELQSRQYLV